jgi:hypothetical protein
MPNKSRPAGLDIAQAGLATRVVLRLNGPEPASIINRDRCSASYCQAPSEPGQRRCDPYLVRNNQPNPLFGLGRRRRASSSTSPGTDRNGSRAGASAVTDCHGLIEDRIASRIGGADDDRSVADFRIWRNLSDNDRITANYLSTTRVCPKIHTDNGCHGNDAERRQMPSSLAASGYQCRQVPYHPFENMCHVPPERSRVAFWPVVPLPVEISDPDLRTNRNPRTGQPSDSVSHLFFKDDQAANMTPR